MTWQAEAARQSLNAGLDAPEIRIVDGARHDLECYVESISTGKRNCALPLRHTGQMHSRQHPRTISFSFIGRAEDVQSCPLTETF
jgi:hypothetical protein